MQLMKQLLNELPKLRGKRIGILGDLIADEYVFGTIHRFSREAPVFIVSYEESQIGPGGAANAANNIQELGGIPCPFGVLGNDPAGRTMFSALKEKGIAADGIVIDERQTTFVKQRIVAGSTHSVKQQILRIDRCLPIPAQAACHETVRERLFSRLGELDALIISDYGLGVVQPAAAPALLSELNRRGVPCFVDSRNNLTAFRGIHAATPNEPEVEALLGQPLDSKNLIESGKQLLKKLNAKALLITRGKNGMALFTNGSDPELIPIFGSTDIVDVTGAGDTVISTFALAATAGISFQNAARLANCAAGIVVMKRGAATVSFDELSEALRVASMNES
jgi:rfaE bifunctional protein kinase chain/domain